MRIGDLTAYPIPDNRPSTSEDCLFLSTGGVAVALSLRGPTAIEIKHSDQQGWWVGIDESGLWVYTPEGRYMVQPWNLPLSR